MLTAKAVAVLLELSPRKVYTIDPALLPRFEFGGAVRYDEQDVERYKASCRTSAPSKPKWEPPPATPKPRKLTARQLAKQEAERVLARAALVRHHSAKRRAEKTTRTPPWADLDKIRALHVEAQRLTLATGIEHQVDHVIPLQGERVSGLHVETNMQILTGAENSRKKNRFEPC